MSRQPTWDEASDALDEWSAPGAPSPLTPEQRKRLAIECYVATKLADGWSAQAIKDGIAAVWASFLKRWGERKGGSSKGRIRKAEPPFVPWYAQGAPTFAETSSSHLGGVGTGTARSDRPGEGAMALPKP